MTATPSKSTSDSAPHSTAIRLGIDLGGTKTEIIALDAKGDIRLRQRVPTPKHSYTAILQSLCDLVNQAEGALGVQGCSVGIGIPGAVSKKTGRIKNANTTVLIGEALDRDLAETLKRPVKLENDANCFALSEAMDGAAKHAKSVFGVILGTGVGGGLVFNQQLICGPNAITGEWGHNPLPWPLSSDEPKQDCYCGKQGCIETYLSGPGMAAQAVLQNNSMLQVSSPLAMPTIQPLTSYDIFSNTAKYKDIYLQYVDRLARGLASVINVFDPECIVLGGGLSNVTSLYEDVPLVWGKYVFSDRVDTLLVKNQHGDSSGVRGAAWL